MKYTPPYEARLPLREMYCPRLLKDMSDEGLEGTLFNIDLYLFGSLIKDCLKILSVVWSHLEREEISYMLHSINWKNKKLVCLVVSSCCSLFMNQVLPAAQKDNHRTERYRSVEASSKIHDVVHSFKGSSAQYITTGERRMLELRSLGEWEQGQYHAFQKPVSLDNKAVLFKWISSESDDASLMFAWMSSSDGFPGKGRGITAQLSQKRTASGAAYFDVTLRTYDGTFSHVRVANGLFRCDPQACHEIVWSRDSEGIVFSFNGVQTRLSDAFNSFLNEVGHLKIGATGGRGEKVLRVFGQGSERYSPDLS